eukprot:scpid64172/ scgid10046/ OTU domain-containing protein 4
MGRGKKRGDHPPRPGSTPMDEFLQSTGRWRKLIAKDGSCLFRAVSEQLFHNQARHRAIRLLCVAYMRLNAETFSCFIDEAFDDYMKKMESPQAWAGQLEIEALSRIYKVDFDVFQDVGAAPTPITSNGYPKKIMLCFSDGSHYDNVYPISFRRTSGMCQTIVYDLVDRSSQKSSSSTAHGESAWASGRLSSASTQHEDQAGRDYRYRNLEFEQWKAERQQQTQSDRNLASSMQFNNGDMCMAKIDGQWMKAEIKRIQPENVSATIMVYVFQLGKRECVPMSRLKSINAQDAATPAPQQQQQFSSVGTFYNQLSDFGGDRSSSTGAASSASTDSTGAQSLSPTQDFAESRRRKRGGRNGQSADGGDVWPSLPSGNASSATADLHSPTTAAAAAVSATSSGGFTQAVMGGGKASGAASMSDFVNDLCTLAMDCADADVKGTTTGAGSAITKPTSAGTVAGVAVAMATSETGVGESVAGGGSVSAGKSKSRRRREARRSAQQNSSSSAAAGTPDRELDDSVRDQMHLVQLQQDRDNQFPELPGAAVSSHSQPATSLWTGGAPSALVSGREEGDSTGHDSGATAAATHDADFGEAAQDASLSADVSSSEGGSMHVSASQSSTSITTSAAAVDGGDDDDDDDDGSGDDHDDSDEDEPEGDGAIGVDASDSMPSMAGPGEQLYSAEQQQFSSPALPSHGATSTAAADIVAAASHHMQTGTTSEDSTASATAAGVVGARGALLSPTTAAPAAAATLALSSTAPVSGSHLDQPQQQLGQAAPLQEQHLASQHAAVAAAAAAVAATAAATTSTVSPQGDAMFLQYFMTAPPDRLASLIWKSSALQSVRLLGFLLQQAGVVMPDIPLTTRVRPSTKPDLSDLPNDTVLVQHLYNFGVQFQLLMARTVLHQQQVNTQKRQQPPMPAHADHARVPRNTLGMQQHQQVLQHSQVQQQLQQQPRQPHLRQQQQQQPQQ